MNLNLFIIDINLNYLANVIGILYKKNSCLIIFYIKESFCMYKLPIYQMNQLDVLCLILMLTTIP